MSKQKLMDEAEESGLSAKGIHPYMYAGARNVGEVDTASAAARSSPTAAGRGALNKQLKSVPKGVGRTHGARRGAIR